MLTRKALGILSSWLNYILGNGEPWTSKNDSKEVPCLLKKYSKGVPCALPFFCNNHITIAINKLSGLNVFIRTVDGVGPLNVCPIISLGLLWYAVLPACQCMYLHTSRHPVRTDMIHYHQRVTLCYCRPSENGRRYYCNIMWFVL